DEKLTWKPHEKARTLGQLALHIAMIPGSIAELVSSSAKTQVPKFTEPSPQTASELVSTLDASIGKAKQLLSKMDDGAIMETWSLMNGDKEVFSLPRVAVLRTVMLNHWYHHRGQLSVYLRELDIPIPSIYGPSADENPFASITRCADQKS